MGKKMRELEEILIQKKLKKKKKKGEIYIQSPYSWAKSWGIEYRRLWLYIETWIRS